MLENTTLEDDETPQTILKKMLSVQSVVSNSSSFAQRTQEPSSDLSLQFFSDTGFGCGVVFAQLGTAHAVKRAKGKGPQSATLWNDFLVHTKVEQGFKVGNISGLSQFIFPGPSPVLATRILLGRYPTLIDSYLDIRLPKTC
ncbi:hypothetical protein LZ554_001031 [Drepanopeziza brunnea f. sp. 'monogermtubi']|nr:hypothetical protein LZ554_001031 [Drepanopeziza brunnea f. sp. 'monogermtubi']